jgi:hypothetical protein
MNIISIKVTVRSAVLCMGTLGSCPVVPQANEPHANLCMLYTAYFLLLSVKWKYGVLSYKKRVLLRKYQLMQPTYISNIGLYHAMHSRYMSMKCKWWMTYGQGRLISNIGPGQKQCTIYANTHRNKTINGR